MRELFTAKNGVVHTEIGTEKVKDMKKFWMAAIIGCVFTNSAFATQNCFDKALLETERFAQKLQACDANVDVKPLMELEKALQSSIIHYGPRVLNKMSAIYEHLYTDLPYEESKLSAEAKKCIQQLGYADFDQLKIEVMDAIIVCRF